MSDINYKKQYVSTAAEVKQMFIDHYVSTKQELTLSDLKPLFIERYGSLEAVPSGVREGVTAGIMHAREACNLS